MPGVEEERTSPARPLPLQGCDPGQEVTPIGGSTVCSSASRPATCFSLGRLNQGSPSYVSPSVLVLPSGPPQPPTPVVHVPEELQVGLVHHVRDLLPVALHQLCVAHQLLLGPGGREEGKGAVSGIHGGEPQTGTSEWASQSSPCPTPSDGGERETARLSWGAHDLQRRGNPAQSSVPQSPGSPQGRGAAAQLRCYIHYRSPPHPRQPGSSGGF